jgi:L-fuculose-phosphate aldolase
LIGNHGAVAGGRNLDEAIVCCQFLEKSACIYLHSQVLGGAKPIPEDLWREERNRYLYKYGKAEDLKDVILE